MRIFFFLLVGFFFFLAPLSVSRLFNPDAVKVVRLLVTLLVGFLSFTYLFPLGAVAKRFLAVFVVLFASALWSDFPLEGLFYKILPLLLFVGGVAVGNSIKEPDDFKVLLRVLIAAAVLAIGVFYVHSTLYEENLLIGGRLSVGGLNANYVGLYSGLYTALAVILALLERSYTWRAVCVLLLVGCVTIAFLSGSRAGFLIAVLAASMGSLLWLVQRGHSTLGAVTFLTCSIGWLLSYWILYEEGREPNLGYYPVDSVEQSRLQRDLFRDTRSSLWREAINKWSTSPLIGIGFNSSDGRWGAVHSSYIQILVETGLFGGTILLLALWRLIANSVLILRNGRMLIQNGLLLGVLATVMVFGVLLHGAGESALVQGSTPLAFLLGLGICQVDVAHGWLCEERSIYQHNPSVRAYAMDEDRPV